MRAAVALCSLLLVFAALSWLAACPPNVVTAEPFDAGADALPPCDGLSVCDEHGDCAGEELCGDAWCWADKGYPAHWCIGSDGGR